MNNLKKKKKGFTLIELMAVIAIIAILAAVLVPTVNGYITRSKKTAVITQVRTIVNAAEAYNATATESSKIKETDLLGAINESEPSKSTGILKVLSESEFIDNTTKLDSLPSDIEYRTLVDINSTQDTLNNITITDGKITKWVGTNSYEKTSKPVEPTPDLK